MVVKFLFKMATLAQGNYAQNVFDQSWMAVKTSQANIIKF